MAKPARVLHFIDTLAAGGAERQLVYLLENLDRARYDCHVVTTYDAFRHYEETLRSLDIPLYSLHHDDLSLLGREGAFRRYARLMWSLRPHIVHSWLHHPNLIARLARTLCPPHRLITAIRSEYAPRQQRSERLTSWLSDFRIVNHPPKTKDHFNANTFYIPNGVPLIEPYLSGTSPTEFTALMVARIDPRKDHLTLLNALHSLAGKLPTDFKMILIGEISDPQTQARIDATVAALTLDTVVQQLPPTHDVTPYYTQATITILPSITEGFSNAILESFAAAKPIIVSQGANSAGLVEHGVNGWIFPTGDSQALAAQIESALQAPEQQRIQMGHNGRAIAEQYSIPRMVEQYTRLYEHTLSRS